MGRRVKRGEIWTISGGGDYRGKPRPAVVLQDNSFDATNSVTICPFTTDPLDAPLFRIVIEPSDRNGLRAICSVMADKITTVPRSKVGAKVGRLDDQDMARLTRAVLIFLGLGRRSRTPRT